MNKITALVLSASVGLMMAGTVRAEDNATDKGHGKGHHKGERFEKADVNKDGKLSLDEFKTMYTKPDAEDFFKAADTDQDGFLTPAELKAAHDARKSAKAARKAEKDGAAK